MTYEQTREQFVLAWNSNAYLNMCESSDMKNAINALEKQIPREIDKYKFKPLNTWVYFCHTCNSMVDQRHSNYCGNCGQALDWSDDYGST